MRFLESIYERNPVFTGIVGIGSSLSSAAFGLLTQIDLIIRIAGGLVGLSIGVITLYGIAQAKGWLRWFRKDRFFK